MSEEDIYHTIDQFVQSAKLAKRVGFTGIQLHAAHGYLLSQFLSPKTNIRKDEWGGSIKNRSRILIEIIRECKSQLGSNYPISVKLNSSDFSKGRIFRCRFFAGCKVNKRREHRSLRNFWRNL